jgi:hypothetical protein
MIRRGFWLTVGAVGGIMAYRRVARVTRKGVARETIRFTRDVRDGMDLYIARHPGGSGPTLGAITDENEKNENEKDDR